MHRADQAWGGGNRAPRWLAPAVILVIAVALLAYTVLRAVKVSFTWDESWTYVRHVVPGMFFQREHDGMGGNHHLLNVWGMILADRLFGNSELALRLPNLAGHALYLYATARIALQARSSVLAIAAFLLLNVHPYLLDFFSLARGYGLANAWMMLSLWHATRYFNGGRHLRNIAFGTICAVLAAMSHVIMVTYLLAYAVAFAAVWAMGKGRSGRFPWGQAAVLGGVTVAGLALVLPNALLLAQGGSLNFGCDSLWHCMMGTFGMKFLYHQPYRWPVLGITGAVIGGVAACSLATWVAALRGRWTGHLRPMGFGMIILAAVLAGFTLQYILFGVPFPQTRTALFLLPLAAYILVSGLVAWPQRTRTPVVMAVLWCIPLLYHQGRSLNTTYAVEWKPSGEASRMLEIIEKDHAPIDALRRTITVATGFETYGSLRYYRERDSLQWITAYPRIAPGRYVPANYYIVEYDGMDQVDTAHWTLLYRSEAVNTNLYRDERWRTPPTVLYRFHQGFEAPGTPGRTAEYHAGGQYSVCFDSTIHRTTDINWVVPDTIGSPGLQLMATMMVAQQEGTNWVSPLLQVFRGGKEIVRAAVNSSDQMRQWGRWQRVVAPVGMEGPLLPGDSVHLEIRQLKHEPAIYVDDLELWVLQ